MFTRKKLVVLAAGLGLLLAACGGGAAAETIAPDASPATTPTTAAPAPQAAGDHAEEAVDGHGGDNAEEAVDRTIEVTLSEFAIEPAVLEVAAGETIRFVVTNEGTVPHEFRLSNQERIEEHVGGGHADHAAGGEDEAGGHDEAHDLFIELEPGQTGELVATFPEDTTIYTETACLLPGHYEAGMKGSVVYSS